MIRLETMLDLGPVSERRAALLRRTLCGFGFALIGVTWRLWTPQTVYPQVPLLAAARNVPGIVDWFLLAGIVVGLGIGLLDKQSSNQWRRALVALAAMMAAMMILDQHRIQPWAYQLLGLALVLACSDSRMAFRLARWWTVGLYFHSAISKFDNSFLHTIGQQFLKAIVGLGSGSLDAWSTEARLTAAWIFPIGELAIAFGLCIPRLRQLAVVGAVAMHVALLVILGPWGLNHRLGVLVWNTFFIAEILILFAWFSPQPLAESERDSAPASVPQPGRGRALAAQAITCAAVLFPFLESVGWMDQWPAWGLYAARESRASVHIQASERDRLPSEMNELLVAEEDGRWLKLPIDRWSLESLQVPVYPDGRFQLGVAEAVAQRYGLNRNMQIVLWSPANRFTGERTQQVLRGLVDIDPAAKGYRFNARPRNL